MPATEVATLTTPAKATSFVIAKTGKIAAAVFDESKVLVWTLPEGTKRAVLVPGLSGGSAIDAVAISEDGRWIATGDHGAITLSGISLPARLNPV
jgi:hypothetical protein